MLAELRICWAADHMFRLWHVKGFPLVIGPVQTRRKELFADWTELLGQWPPLIKNPEVEVLSLTKRENFTQHQIRFR